ncbi:YbaY family lipoprotein [Lysobacter panacisoli]|uniref:C-type lysozyme inhibitor domain-containing protein n=1 Tax=Lysobacter panacisoli TaxID=1255263 RepID=A0ABP9LAR4_9GAMM|nr:YbaY family lipoprotein [Lysobacter panacisoli]
MNVPHRLFRAASVAAVICTLVACRPAGPEPSTQAPPLTRGAHAVTGNATYLERILMPPGSTLRVQLIDSQLADTLQAVIADATLRDLSGPPYAFSLPYDPVKLRPNGQYGLHATLSGPDGRPWFVTDTRVPVDPARNEPVELRLVRVKSAQEAGTGATKPTYWQCGETRIGASFEGSADAGKQTVALSINGRALSLPLARSASGARYADDAGNEFWTKGASGTLTLAGEDKRECTQADGPSPWDAARERGVAFRAVGNEPGWLVEVGSGDSPSLHAELDYGSRKIDIATVQRDKDGLRYSGQTANGTKIELAVERKRCEDPMSGASFDASAQLQAGGKTYRGCGAFLDAR